jgi:prophage regulatory protein
MKENEKTTKFIRLPEVMRRVGLCRSSIYAFIAKGQFPRNYSLGGRACGFLESDIDAWIDARLQEGQNQRAA